jgi:acetyl-CoA carboxylase biotin carboxyl carrier protein
MTVDIDSPVAGRVISIECRAGDSVVAEDVILTLESMKMEIPVEAPQAGRVSEIRVGVGDTVAEGDILARFDA